MVNAMSLKVLDVYSGSGVDMVKNTDADGVIVKATQGVTYVNPICNSQYDAAKSKGLLTGLYHYAEGGDPIREADFFIDNISNYVGGSVLALDWESVDNGAWGNTFWARQFVDRVHARTGVWPIIYVQASAIQQVASCAKDCGLWVAGYPDLRDNWNAPAFPYNISPWSAYTGWQFSTSNGTMDRSVFDLDANGWAAIAKGSGEVKDNNHVETKAPDTSFSIPLTNVTEVANRVINGQVGDGDVRKEKLGKWYNAIQAIVNRSMDAIDDAELYRILAEETKKGVFGDGNDRIQFLDAYYDGTQATINGSTIKNSYIVESGDNLSTIAAKLHTTVDRLVSVNGITDPNVIYPGQELRYDGDAG